MNLQTFAYKQLQHMKHWARVEHAYLGVPINLAECRSNESVFHLILQNNVAPNIGQNCQTISDPIILGAGLCTTCRVERVLVVIRFNPTFLPLRPYCEKICTSFLNDAEVQQRMVRTLMQSHFLYSFLFLEHYNRISHCD